MTGSFTKAKRASNTRSSGYVSPFVAGGVSLPAYEEGFSRIPSELFSHLNQRYESWEEPKHNQAFRRPDESASQTSQAEALNSSVLAESLWNHTHTHRVLIQAPRLFLHMSFHEQ
jgi:hypothetical protein